MNDNEADRLAEPMSDARIEEVRKACVGPNSGLLYANLFARAILAEAGIKEKT